MARSRPDYSMHSYHLISLDVSFVLPLLFLLSTLPRENPDSGRFLMFPVTSFGCLSASGGIQPDVLLLLRSMFELAGEFLVFPVTSFDCLSASGGIQPDRFASTAINVWIGRRVLGVPRCVLRLSVSERRDPTRRFAVIHVRISRSVSPFQRCQGSSRAHGLFLA